MENTPVPSTDAHELETTQTLRRFLADPRVKMRIENTETLYILEIENEASLGIRFDEHNICTGDAEYEGQSDSFELDKDEIDLVCDYINAH